MRMLKKILTEVNNMGRPKKHMTRTVSFGGTGHPARILIEIYEKQNGKQKLSELVRKLIILYLAPKPEYIEYKKQMMLESRNDAIKNIKEHLNNRQIIEKKLGEMGVDVDSLYG